MNVDPKKLLELYKPKPFKVVNLDRQMGIIRFSSDGKILAGGGLDGTIRRFDEQLTELPKLTGHNGWIQALAFHPDGKRLVTADSWGQVSCWPFADTQAKPLWTLPQAHDGWVRALAISLDGKQIATAGMDRMIRIWSADDGKKLAELPAGEDVYTVLFHPDGKALVSGDFRGAVKHWDLAGGKTAREFDARLMFTVSRLQDVGGARCLAFDKDGKTLAVGGTQPKGGATVQGLPTILLFDWASGKQQQLLTYGADVDNFIHDVHFHPGAFLMAVSSGQPGTGKLVFFQPGDKEPFFLQAIPNCHSLAVHPKGQRLVVAATNAGSNGNGRPLKNGEYPGNFSPLHILDLPKPA